MERSVTLLPEPDSPSTASTCPGRSSKLTALTARTTPSRVENSTLRSRTLRSDMLCRRRAAPSSYRIRHGGRRVEQAPVGFRLVQEVDAPEDLRPADVRRLCGAV